MTRTTEYSTGVCVPCVQHHHAVRVDGDEQVLHAVPHHGRGAFVRDVHGRRPDQVVGRLTAVYLGHVRRYVREFQSLVQVSELQHHVHVELLQCNFTVPLLPSSSDGARALRTDLQGSFADLQRKEWRGYQSFRHVGLDRVNESSGVDLDRVARVHHPRRPHHLVVTTLVRQFLQKLRLRHRATERRAIARSATDIKGFLRWKFGEQVRRTL